MGRLGRGLIARNAGRNSENGLTEHFTLYMWAILSEFPGTSLKRLLSPAHLRLADRSDACEGPGWTRTEHMQQESGYVGGVPKMATGAEAF